MISKFQTNKKIRPAARPEDLPNFESPPISEVVLSIQFASLESVKSVHIGLFWDRIRAEYPDVTERGTLNAVFETFGTPSPRHELVQFEQFLSPPMPRYWFEKSGEPDLLQLQQDRIIHNWRKRETAAIYPRYETVRASFKKEVDGFVDWLSSEKLGEFRANQCEVTYVNIIQVPGVDRLHENINRVTPLWTGKPSEEFKAAFETAAMQLRLRLVENEKPVGRVHVAFQSAFLQSDPNSEVVRLEIAARGRPTAEGVDGAFEFLDKGRRAVVQTFASVTTREMHKLWGRIDGRK